MVRMPKNLLPREVTEKLRLRSYRNLRRGTLGGRECKGEYRVGQTETKTESPD
jgi:hypothetical protein